MPRTLFEMWSGEGADLIEPAFRGHAPDHFPTPGLAALQVRGLWGPGYGPAVITKGRMPSVLGPGIQALPALRTWTSMR